MRILIADDEPIIRLGLKAMIEEMGHQVILAADGREALQQARRESIDMAILDIKMPYTDGLQAARALNNKKSLPILFLTAYSDRDVVEQATDLPVQGYLVKPVTAGELAAAISVATKRHKESESLRKQASELEARMKTRKLLEQAKGKLMEAGMSEDEAYKAIQRQARQNRQSMGQIARKILDGAE